MTARGEPSDYLNYVALNHIGNECLIWPYGKRRGYGSLRVNGKHKYVHRHICEIVHGQATTPEHEASHSCGKGSVGCCSPHHIFWETPVENQARKLEHGTHNRGERSARAKLTDSQVIEIRRRVENGELRAKLSIEFNVLPQTIGKIYNRKLWSHVEEVPSND